MTLRHRVAGPLPVVSDPPKWAVRLPRHIGAFGAAACQTTGCLSFKHLA